MLNCQINFCAINSSNMKTVCFDFYETCFFLFIKEIFLNFFVLFIELQVPLYNWYIKDYRNGNHVLIEVIFNSCHGIQAWLWYGNENTIGIELDFWAKGREVCDSFWYDLIFWNYLCNFGIQMWKFLNITSKYNF